MLSVIEFENLLNRSESTILDFKAENYKLVGDTDLSHTSKFVKDIISFSNTVRTESAYIILGVGEEEDKSKKLLGLNTNIDDAIFQDKIKDKVFPRPHFDCYTLRYNGLDFGIIEIPVTKYQSPIAPSIKMKGLEMGKVYFRRGTTNTEAHVNEVIAISDWLRSLPEINEGNNLRDEIGQLIKRLTLKQENLSVIVTDIFTTAQKYGLQALKSFAIQELKGFDVNYVRANENEFDYRTQKVIFSMNSIKLNPHYNVTSVQIRNEMLKMDHFYEHPFLVRDPLIKIEQDRDMFLDPKNAYATVKMNSKDIFPDMKEYTVFVYSFRESFSNLYESIRQKLIDKLMEE